MDALLLFMQAIGAEEAGQKSAAQLGYIWNRISMCWNGLKTFALINLLFYILIFRYDRAVRAVEKAIQYQPSNTTQIFNQAIYYSKLGEHQWEIESLKKLLALDPNNERVKRKLAELRVKKEEIV
jgi:tetratricopeptide (TPR) repeat protein